MNSPKQFIFDRYEISEDGRTVNFYYRTVFEDREDIIFQESLTFAFALDDPGTNDNLAAALHFYHIVAGVSYYKAHLAPQISSHGLDPWAAEAASEIYRHGLGEFIYMNGLEPDAIARFEPESMQKLPTTKSTASGDKWLVPVGGGKDSLVTTTILEQTGQEFESFRINPNSWISRQLDEIGAPQQLVEREFDAFLTSDKQQYRGHVPITAIVSAAATIVAVVHGHETIAFSNEASADEPTIEDYHGMAVNHQWAKSAEAEELIQQWISRYISADLDYYSLIRPLGELEIAELFAAAVLPQYSGLWSSSNTNFRRDAPDKLDWDLTSPKTCTVFLLLAPFVVRDTLIEEFSGNPFTVEANADIWPKLLGKTDNKPFECVATVEEMQRAWQLADETGQWPDLKQLL